MAYIMTEEAINMMRENKMLTLEELAYSQQKNREYIYEEYVQKSQEIYGFSNWEYIDTQFEKRCKQLNIKPWII